MRRRYIQLVLALVVVAVVIFAATRLAGSELATSLVADWGYLGALIVAAVSGFNVLLPIPVVAFFPLFLAAGLDFWILLITVTVGMTLGDSVGYLLGNTGRRLVDPKTARSRAFKVVESFRKRHVWAPYVLLFLYVSFAPAPNEILVIPMAFAGYKFRYMFPIILVGNFVFNLITAISVTSISGLF